MEIQIIFIILLLFISALLAGSESAIFSLELSTIDSLKNSANNKVQTKATLLKQWVQKPERILFTILLTNLITNITFTSYFDIILNKILPDNSNFQLLSLIIITATILLFAEIFPKILAIQIRKRWCLQIVPLLNIWNTVVQKIFFIFQGVEKNINKYFPEEKIDFREEEIIEALEQSEKKGLVSKAEKEKLHRYVIFQSDTAYSAMMPRSLVAMLSENSIMSKAKKLFQKIQISRSPRIALVYRDSELDILGYLHVKNFVKIFHTEKTIKDSIQPILHIPATMLLRDVLEKFIKSNQEIAIVLSEDGTFLGILSLQIVLQRLMGNFTPNIVPLIQERIVSDKENYFRIPGALLISSFNRYFYSKFSSNNTETIAGLVLKHLDGFPEYSTKLKIKNFLFTNFQVKNNKIIFCEVQLLKE